MIQVKHVGEAAILLLPSTGAGMELGVLGSRGMQRGLGQGRWQDAPHARRVPYWARWRRRGSRGASGWSTGRIDLAVLGLQSIGVIDQRAPRGSSRSVAWAHPLQQPWLIWLRGPRPVRHVHGGPTSWGVSGSWMWARTTRVLRAPRSIARWNRTLRPPCMPLARTRRPSTQAQARSVPW